VISSLGFFSLLLAFIGRRRHDMEIIMAGKLKLDGISAAKSPQTRRKRLEYSKERLCVGMFRCCEKMYLWTGLLEDA
jgi:hypothetical protein